MPGLNFIYVHLKRVIKAYNLNMIHIIGPGHGRPEVMASAASMRSSRSRGLAARWKPATLLEHDGVPQVSRS
jgi:hypothetical protein